MLINISFSYSYTKQHNMSCSLLKLALVSYMRLQPGGTAGIRVTRLTQIYQHTLRCATTVNIHKHTETSLQCCCPIEFLLISQIFFHRAPLAVNWGCYCCAPLSLHIAILTYLLLGSKDCVTLRASYMPPSRGYEKHA